MKAGGKNELLVSQLATKLALCVPPVLSSRAPGGPRADRRAHTTRSDTATATPSSSSATGRTPGTAGKTDKGKKATALSPAAPPDAAASSSTGALLRPLLLPSSDRAPVLTLDTSLQNLRQY